MSSQNRDWYREWWAKKTGYVEKSAFRLPARRKSRGWHPVFAVLLGALIVLGVYFASRLIPLS